MPAERRQRPLRAVLVAFAIAALLVGGVVSWFASKRPDGLEWSARRVSGREELPSPTGAWHHGMDRAQKATSSLPNYSFGPAQGQPQASTPRWPAPNAGTSASGLIGAGLTLLVALGVGLGLRVARPHRKRGRGARTLVVHRNASRRS